MVDSTRRLFLSGSAVLGASALLAACKDDKSIAPDPPLPVPAVGSSPPADAGGDASSDATRGASSEVAAVEDLMREHGVLRRALIVYRESAVRLRASAASVSPGALQKTAKLFRAFGEDYHERKLEEAYIFPAVKKLGGPSASYPDVLTAQHARGREITDYVLAVTQAAKVGASASVLAGVLDAFVRMYESHMAFEDTIVFPAWKRTMTVADYDEIGDKFEDIEHESFGKDGFEDAAQQIAAVEKELGLGDLAKVTAPPPPAR